MTIKHSALNTLSLFYIYLPILIFLFGWCTWYIAIPCATILLGVLYVMLRAYNSEGKNIQISKTTFIVAVVLLLIMAYYLGWGRFTNQCGDANRNNGILNDMVYRSWPIIYSDHHGGYCMLTYYFLQFLVAGIVGKMFFSYRLAELVFAVWSLLGVTLVYFNLIRSLNVYSTVKRLFVLWVLFFFMLPLTIGRPVIEALSTHAFFYEGTGETLWVSETLQLPLHGNWMRMFYDYQQAITPWLITILLIEFHKYVRFYVPLILPALMYGAFPFVALLPYAAILAVMNYCHSVDKKQFYRDMFSVPNVAVSLSIGIVFVTYLWGNVSGVKPDIVSARMVSYQGHYTILLLYHLLVTLPFPLLVFKEHKKNALYYLTVLFLLLIPFVKIGVFNDQRKFTTIVHFFLMYFLLQYLLTYRWGELKTSNIKCFFTFLLLFVSFMIPFQNLRKQIQTDEIGSLAEDKGCGTLENWSNRADSTIRIDLRYNYFTYDVESSVFYKYMARPSKYDIMNLN